MKPAIEHVTFCDLLQGRSFRLRAGEFLDDALLLEAMARDAPRSLVDEIVDRAAHAEWIATIAEQGRVGWGRRHNRCGNPDEEQDSGQRTADSSGIEASP